MTSYEAASREAKAERIAAVIATDPRVACHADLGRAGEGFRAMVAALAGVRTPSERTWDRAVELARLEMRARGQAALRYVDDERYVPA